MSTLNCEFYLSFINGEHKDVVWTVRDSSEEAQVELVDQFISFCQQEADRMIVDQEIISAIEHLKTLNQNPPPGFDKNDIFKLKNHLETMTTVSVYGFNSSRYDLAIIFDFIVRVLDRPGFNRKSVSLLKKGTAYFSCSFGSLHFKDLLNFTCPMSLDRYLQTWTSDSFKLCYPYEKFASIEDIRSQIDFPDIDDFKSILKGDVNAEVYESCRLNYNQRLTLPEGHPDKWYNFEDYLKFYNLSDVKPASLALIKQFDTYLENFGSYPNHFLGLPSFAKYSMFKLYDETCPNIFTFPQCSDATQVFREGIVGGLTNVYKRHVTLDEDEEATTAAKYSKRGKKWRKIEFYDINSMYPTTFKEKFPCGVGFEWSPDFSNRLSKKLMTNRKISMESLEWLDYMQQEKLHL